MRHTRSLDSTNRRLFGLTLLATAATTFATDDASAALLVRYEFNSPTGAATVTPSSVNAGTATDLAMFTDVANTAGDIRSARGPGVTGLAGDRALSPTATNGKREPGSLALVAIGCAELLWRWSRSSEA